MTEPNVASATPDIDLPIGPGWDAHAVISDVLTDVIGVAELPDEEVPQAVLDALVARGWTLNAVSTPAEITEQAARTLALTDDYDGCFERLDAWEAATAEQREGSEVEKPMLTDVEDAEWWRRRARALASTGLLAHQSPATPAGEAECDICAAGTWGSGEGGHKGGWREAMRFAHHAHAERTYRGHPSANGVLGAGPDSVIVDGDWLANLEELAASVTRPVAETSDLEQAARVAHDRLMWTAGVNGHGQHWESMTAEARDGWVEYVREILAAAIPEEADTAERIAKAVAVERERAARAIESMRDAVVAMGRKMNVPFDQARQIQYAAFSNAANEVRQTPDPASTEVTETLASEVTPTPPVAEPPLRHVGVTVRRRTMDEATDEGADRG